MDYQLDDQIDNSLVVHIYSFWHFCNFFFSRDLREDLASVQSRELELSHKKSDLEKQLELAEAETLTVKNELKIALRRIDDLQAAIGGEMDSDFVSDQVLLYCVNCC